MAATATPYGFKPVKSLDQRPYTGATRQFKIASGYATNIFNGDVVKCVNDGTIAKDTGTTTLTPIGVFLGVSATSGVLGYYTQSQYWAASTVASNAFAYVVDDPFAVFQIQADGSVAQTSLFLNAGVTQTAGSTATGDSKVTLTTSTLAVTNTLPIRVVGFVGGACETVSPADAFTDCLVIWNFGMHQYLDPDGI